MIDILTENPRLFYVLVGFLALIVWSNREVRRNFYSISADVFGVITILVALLFAREFVYLFTDVDAKAVTRWFIFYAAISYWSVPVFILLGAWFFGRIIGRIFRRLTRRFRTKI